LDKPQPSCGRNPVDLAKYLDKQVSVMNTKPLLILSLALNVVFGVVIITTLSPETDSTVGLSGTGNYSEFPLGQATTNSHQVVTNTDVKQMTWETVEAADYRVYIENLRNIDCPEETIRDIILADVNKL